MREAPASPQTATPRSNHARIELPSRAGTKLGEGLVRSDRRRVGAIAGHGVECIANSDCSRAEGNVVTGQPIWIPVAVEALVVGPHKLGDMRERRRGKDDALANRRVCVRVNCHSSGLSGRGLLSREELPFRTASGRSVSRRPWMPSRIVAAAVAQLTSTLAVVMPPPSDRRVLRDHGDAERSARAFVEHFHRGRLCAGSLREARSGASLGAACWGRAGSALKGGARASRRIQHESRVADASRGPRQADQHGSKPACRCAHPVKNSPRDRTVGAIGLPPRRFQPR